MFNKKKEKELIDRINELEEENKSLSEDSAKQLNRTDEYKNIYKNGYEVLKDAFDTLVNNNESPDQVRHSLSVIKTGMSLLIERDSSLQEFNDQEEESWKDLLSRLDELNEDDEEENYYSGDSILKSAEDLEDMLTDLEKEAKNMSVLSLNSAIEAGRLGEDGLRYVETAEKMREMAETYRNKAVLAKKSISDIKDNIGILASKSRKDQSEDEKKRDSIAKIREEAWQYLQSRRERNAMEEKFKAESLISESDALEEEIGDLFVKINLITEKMKYALSSYENEDGMNEIERKLKLNKENAEGNN